MTDTAKTPPDDPERRLAAEALRQAIDWLMAEKAAASVDDRAQIQAARQQWLAEDPLRNKAYRKAERVWRLSGEALPLIQPGETVPMAETPPVVVVFPSPSVRKNPWRRRVGGLAAAACLVLVVISGGWMPWGAEYRTGTGTMQQIALADGSQISLAAGSALDTALSADRRGVILREGQAFFQVAPDRQRPFVVSAGAMTITVTGTAFDVQREETETVVAVASGAVEVRIEGGETLSLKPGDRVRLTATGRAIQRDRVTAQELGLWRDGRLVVSNQPVMQVIETLRHHFHGLIVLQDADGTGQVLAGRAVTGVFDLRDPRTALETIARLHGGSVRQITPYVLVVSAADGKN